METINLSIVCDSGLPELHNILTMCLQELDFTCHRHSDTLRWYSTSSCYARFLFRFLKLFAARKSRNKSCWKSQYEVLSYMTLL
jgi:hypothetical protein